MNCKTLIVDDEPIICRGLRYTVPWETIGIEVVGEAYNGQQALEKLRHTDISIVITDVKMPVMDGIELTSAIRELYPRMKIIVLSGYDDFHYARQAMRLGVKDYLLKPVDVDELLGVLRYIVDAIRQEHTERLCSEHKAWEQAFSDHLRGLLPWQHIHERAAERGYGSAMLVLAEIAGGPGDFIQPSFEESGLPFIFIKVKENLAAGFYLVENEPQTELFAATLQKIAGSMPKLRLAVSDGPVAWEQIKKSYDHLLSSLRSTHIEVRRHYVIEKAMQHIRENYAKELRATDIANTVHISPNYFSHLFKQDTGKNFNEFLNEVRVEHAKKLLAGSRVKVFEISELVGYKQYKHFTRIFKEIANMTPTEYRVNYYQESFE